jgi:tRNA threonylcarbamoyladenosine biosynthesis protein TsaB
MRRAFRRPYMIRLRQLVGEHSPALLLDASSARVQVGWMEREDQSQWQSADAEAGVGIFQCLEAMGRNPSDAASLVFCDGPGSILGIRTTAMAIRTWNVLSRRPVFAYASLALLAHALGDAETTVIADARRDAWHTYRVGHHLRRTTTRELPEQLIMPENFRHWSPLPPRVRIVPYSVAELLPRVPDVELFRPIESPDAFLHEEPSYATWQPQIHRAPSPP